MWITYAPIILGVIAGVIAGVAHCIWTKYSVRKQIRSLKRREWLN